MSETTEPPLEVVECDNELLHEPRFPTPSLSDASVGVGIEPITASIIAICIASFGLLVTTTGTSIGIANFIIGGRRITDLQNNVDALLLGQKDIVAELRRLRGEIEWTQILTLISRPVQIIQYFIDEIRLLIPPLDWDQAKIDAWRKRKEHEAKECAKAVLAETGGLRQQLSFINTAFRGTGGLTKPLMEIVIDKEKSIPYKTQSAYFIVCAKYRSLKYYEAQALGALAYAYKIEHPDATDPQIDDYIKPYQQVYEKQIIDTLPLLVPLNRFWTPFYSGNAQAAPINWNQQWHVVYGDRHQVRAADGCVLVGLNFYKKGNRVALGITQAKLDKAGDIDVSSRQKITNQEWGDDYFQIGPNAEIQLMTTVLSPDCMATGVRLWLEGNKLMVLLEYVRFNFVTRTADFSKRAWTSAADAKESPGHVKWFSSDPDGNVADGSDRGRVGFDFDVTPDPLSPITGVMLDMSVPTPKYLLARIKTDFYSPDRPTPKSA